MHCHTSSRHFRRVATALTTLDARPDDKQSLVRVNLPVASIELIKLAISVALMSTVSGRNARRANTSPETNKLAHHHIVP
jgi:hypothetical protein